MARIALDLDGVCYNFESSVRDFLVNKHGFLRSSLPDPIGWHIDQQWGMSRRAFQGYCHEGVDDRFIFRTGSAYPGTREGVEMLRAAGHSIHINTARGYGSPGMSALNTEEWLAQEGIKYDSLTLSGDKTILDVDYMIDDRLENAFALRDAGTIAVLMDQAWNREGRKDLPWVPNLPQFALLVNMMEMAK